MKYISFLVPCYNSEKFLHKAVESLLPGGEDVEIIIVNDGSKDNTLKVAKEFEKKYPNIVKVIDKENGGHGSGINQGVIHATGEYFKVLDSDDWADMEGYKKILAIIKENCEKKLYPDTYITKFYYDHFDTDYKYALPLEKRFPINEMFSWNKVKTKHTDVRMLHSLFFRLSLLKDNNIVLLEKTFYEDCECVYKTLYHTKTMYYINEVFYHYYIGRDDQSVSPQGMEKHYQDYLKVLRVVFKYKSYAEIKQISKYHRRHIFDELMSVFALVFIACFGIKKKEKSLEYKALMKELKNHDKKLYHKIRYRTLYVFTLLFFPPIRSWMIRVGISMFDKNMKWTKKS